MKLFFSCVFSVLLLNSVKIFAFNNGMEEDWSTVNYWQCTTSDANNTTWSAKSTYELSALNKSFADCKSNSNLPLTCKTAKINCEFFHQGSSTKSLWKCTAFDEIAKPWVSNAYEKRDDAAIAAKAYCQEKSGSPDSCFINLLTCKNINSHN